MTMLKRSIAREYHRQSVGMYLAILLLAFGFLRGEEHIQLARLVMGRTTLLLLVVLLWGLQVVKSSFFFVKLMRQPQYEVLFETAFLPTRKKLLELTLMQISLNAIFLLYAAFMFVIGVMEKQWVSGGVLLAVNIIYIVTPVLWKAKLLRSPADFHQKNKLFEFQLPKIAYPSWSFFTVFLLKKEPFYLLLQKLFAAVVIAGMAYFYPTDDYDERLLKLGLFVVASGYFTLAQQYEAFYVNSMLFTRNLPISTLQFFISHFLSAVIFTLPELVLFVSYLPDNVNYMVVFDTYFFAVTVAVFWQVAIFWIDLQDSRRSLFLFLGHIILVIMLMFKIPLSVIGVVILLTSYLKLKANYLRYEATVN